MHTNVNDGPAGCHCPGPAVTALRYPASDLDLGAQFDYAVTRHTIVIGGVTRIA
jgi:hypothetical protein